MNIKSVLVGLVIGLTLWVILPFTFIILSDYFNLPIINLLPLKIIGVITIILALIPILHSFHLFKIIGNGTPVPIEPPKKLVVAGLYKYTRNPMYLSHIIIFLGEYLIFGRKLQLLYLFLAFTGFNLYLKKMEEPKLIERFGKKFIEYTNKVPRWL